MKTIELTYIGRRYLDHKKVSHAFVSDEGETQMYDLKSFWLPVGARVQFEQGATETQIKPGTAKQIGLHDDEEQVAAWKLEDRATMADSASRKFGEKRGELVDEHIDALNRIIERLTPLDRSRARYYIVTRLLSGRK